VINFLKASWQPKHNVTLGLFEAINTTGQTLAKNLIELLDTYELRKKMLLMSRMVDLT
jgi:hypothetical protein